MQTKLQKLKYKINIMWCHIGSVWCRIFGFNEFTHSWNSNKRYYAFTYTPNVSKEWFCDYEQHRGDGPAVISYLPHGNIQYTWYHYGDYHREGGPAIYDKKKTCERWYHHGELHRNDGPSFTQWVPPKDDHGRDVDIYVKYEYHKRGELHRLDGPSTIWSNGEVDYHLMGFCIDNDFIQWMKDRNMDLTNLSEEDKMIIYLEWPEISEIIRLTLR